MCLQPVPHLGEALDELGLDRAVRPRADVQEQVGVVARRLHEQLHDLLRALVAVVVLVVAPGPVDRVAHLEGQRPDLDLVVESRGVGARQVLLEHLEVLAGVRAAVVVAAHERRRLEVVDELVGPAEAPVGLGLVPPAVEPDPPDLAVPRQQLAQLRVHGVQVAVPVALLVAAGEAAGPAAREVVGVVPVELRVVEEELDALLVAGVGQHLQHVLPVGRAVHDVVVAHLRVEHREAVVVLRRDRDVPHARGLGHRHPRRRVVLDGVERRRHVPLVLRDREALLLHDPLALAGHGVDTPVDEEPEAGLPEPLARLQVLRPRRVALLRRSAGGEESRDQHGEGGGASRHRDLQGERHCESRGDYRYSRCSSRGAERYSPSSSRGADPGNATRDRSSSERWRLRILRDACRRRSLRMTGRRSSRAPPAGSPSTRPRRCCRCT